jgi:hypothetical protein
MSSSSTSGTISKTVPFGVRRGIGGSSHLRRRLRPIILEGGVQRDGADGLEELKSDIRR